MASGTDKRQRTKTITIRVTDDEHARIEEKSARAGMARGAFARAAMLDSAGPRAQRRPPVDHVALRQLLGELGRIGNNINQIARQLNSGDTHEAAELREATQAYLILRDAILDALGMEPSGDYQGRQQSGA